MTEAGEVFRALQARARARGLNTQQQLELQPLAEALRELRDVRASSWRRYRQRTGLDVLPGLFSDVLDFCVAFADPVLSGSVTAATWHPERQRWRPAA